MDVMEQVASMTGGRIQIGAGTMYTLLADFQKSGMIEETAVEGRKRSYRITEKGRNMLAQEYERLQRQIRDYENTYDA